MSKFDYTYNPVGSIATWTTQSGTSSAIVNTLSYDKADQLTGNTQSGGATAGNRYNYDPAGNRLAETTLSGSTVTSMVGGVFNNLNQLTVTGTAATTTISGTTSGPVSAVTVNAVTATLTGSTSFTASVPTVSGTNVLTIVATPTGTSTPIATQRFALTATGSTTTTLSYDSNGNTTTDENGNTYKWDALNRLTAIIYPGGTHTEFAYDGLSRRVQIVERAGTTVGSGVIASTKNYLWVGSEIAEERDASNVVTKRFFPQGEQQSGTNYYYTRDHLGSVREMTDSSGTIQARYAYDPCGRTTLVSGTNLATRQYAGMYMHQTSGLYLTPIGNTYDPTMGRWIGSDPLGEKASLNLYAYVSNNPINKVDPLGLWGVGVQDSANAETGNIIDGAGVTGQVGTGLFVDNNNFGVTDGSFASGGAFARVASHSAQYPGGTGQTPWVLGTSAGGGVGLFATNANTVSDLAGPFHQYNINLLFGSISIAYDPTSGSRNMPWTWTTIVSITVGKGIGLSASGYSTTTTVSCPGQLAAPPNIPMQKLTPAKWN